MFSCRLSFVRFHRSQEKGNLWLYCVKQAGFINFRRYINRLRGKMQNKGYFVRFKGIPAKPLFIRVLEGLFCPKQAANSISGALSFFVVFTP